MLGAGIGTPASSSQNMISRSSCWARVASLIGSILAASSPLHQAADDRLVEAVAHRALGDRGVVPGGERGAQAGVALGTVGDDEEAAGRRRELEGLGRGGGRDGLR